jgi:hypothetical protein
MKVTIEIDNDLIAAILESAIEQGDCQHWMAFSSETLDMINNLEPSEMLSSAVLKSILEHGYALPVIHRRDHNELLGVLTEANIEKRLNKLAKEMPSVMMAILSGNHDDFVFTNPIDITMQYMVMSKVVF